MSVKINRIKSSKGDIVLTCESPLTFLSCSSFVGSLDFNSNNFFISDSILSRAHLSKKFYSLQTGTQAHNTYTEGAPK